MSKNRSATLLWFGSLLTALLGTSSAGAAVSSDSTSGAMGASLALEQRFAKIVRQAMPAVVSVRRFQRDDAWWARVNAGREKTPHGWREVPKDDLLYAGFRPTSGASGFLVSKDGYVLTLNRIARAGGEARDQILDIEVGTSHYRSRVVALEPTIDLAILKIDPPQDVPFLRLGNSSTLEPGHLVLAFGDPPGPEKTILPGVVVFEPSRECYQEELSATYIQSSFRVPSGALGGPLVNMRGEVVGLHTRRGDSAAADSLAGEGGSGFALPSNLAIAIYQSLLARESKESPWLGISVLLPGEDVKKTLVANGLSGIVIDNVFDPSPATEVGIQVGDVLVSMDGHSIQNVYDFQGQLYLAGIGAKVKLGILRGSKRLDLDARVARRPPEATTR